MTYGSLFTGVAGFDLAAKWMGWDIKFHCELNKFCQQILKYYWSNVEGFGDITKTCFKKYANKIDVLSAGFPCQPFSNSGEQLGEADTRYLLPENLRAIREIKPRWVVSENVYGITSPKFKSVFTEIYSSLEAEGYEIQTYIIPASAVDADHERERVWFVAHSNRARQQSKGKLEYAISEKKIANREASRTKLLFSGEPVPHLFEHNDGFSKRLVNITFSEWRLEANKAMGNAVYPEIPYQIFKTIEQYETFLMERK